MAFKAFAKVLTLSGKSETYGSGPNITQTQALNELQAVLGTIVGVVIQKVTVSEEIDVVASLLLLHLQTTYEDAVLTLKKPGALLGTTQYRTLTIENMSLVYKESDPGSNHIDITQPDIVAIQQNYRDGAGLGGYTLVGGGSSYYKN